MQEGLEAGVLLNGAEQEVATQVLQTGVTDVLTALQPAQGIVGITPLCMGLIECYANSIIGGYPNISEGQIVFTHSRP